MSETHDEHTGPVQDSDDTGQTAQDDETRAPVEVRRNVPLAAAVGTVAGLLTVAFAVRAISGNGGALDWLALGVLALVTIAYVVTLIDSRAPLMVVDSRGVRLREGGTWEGIAWPDVDCMEHLPRKLPLRDGHLLVVGYDDRQLVVPLTLATRVVGTPVADLSDTLAELADGRADVVEVVPGIEEDGDPGDGGNSAATSAPAASNEDTEQFRPPATPASPAPFSAVTSAEDTVDLSGGQDLAPDPDEVATGEIPAVDPDAQDEAGRQDPTGRAEAVAAPPLPGRTTILAARVDTAVAERPRVASHPSADPQPAADPLPDPLTDPLAETDVEQTQTVVLQDLAVQPAPTPVIGPQLAEARERLRLSIDQLSDRTRIRPHVIEAIEADDFAPCGGDFYARGHLRTLSRVLGIDAGPLVRTYDDTYADAPVDPRRVFESELATGHGGSIRSTRGGRNWSVLISAVMAAVLVWSVARLLLGGPAPVENPPVLNQSGGITHAATKGDPVKVVLTAARGGANLIVRDAHGRIVLQGPLAFGQTADLKAVAPVRIWSSDGSVTASVDGRPAKALGKTGEQASATFIAR